MAVLLEGAIKRFIGLSTDDKPGLGYYPDGSIVTGNDLPAGSSFLETDTGLIYRWDGREWTVHIAESETAQYLQAILFELASIKEVLMDGLGGSPGSDY